MAAAAGAEFLGFDGGNHIFLGHTTIFTSTGDAVRIDAVLFGHLARSRSQDWLFTCGCGSSRSSSLSRGSSRRRCGGGSSTSLQLAEQLAAQHGIAFVLDDLGQHAVSFGEHFHHHLVGFDVDDQLITLDRVARLLVPGGNGAVGNRFRECRGFDLDSHYSGVLLIRFLHRGRDIAAPCTKWLNGEGVLQQFFLLFGMHGGVTDRRRR